MISHLTRDEIDESKWNDCIQSSASNLPYAYTWYLDCVAERWDALVKDDYEAVFPLVWRRRFFICYLYQPFFTQQLGVFSKKELDKHVVEEFLNAIPDKFRFIEINLNYLNRVKQNEFELIPRTNLCLDLSLSYENLFSNYHENARRNVHKAEKKQLLVRSDFAPEIVIEFFKANTGNKIPEMGEYHYEHLHELMDEALKREAGKMLGVFDRQENLYAAGFFIITEKRIINLLPSIDDEGKAAGAGFSLIDHVIRQHSGTGKVLDFEGSMIPSIARFYKSFGAEEQTYWRLRRNNLPWLVRWLKR